ncbi:hypothetical protein QP556_07025, partial [Citrobacter freundii]|uniref:hypothetical protein n=1 Tax=Citrobacter freundii TaxID=546 RepID=UPI00254F142D
KRAYCLKTQPATGETYPKSDLFNKAVPQFTFNHNNLSYYYEHSTKSSSSKEEHLTDGCDYILPCLGFM